MRLKDANGKTTSVSVTESTYNLCIAKARAIKSGIAEIEKKKTAPTLGAVIDEYISSRDNLLSKSTVPKYKSYRNHRLKNYIDKPIDQIDWQKMINDEAADVSAKTVHNVWSLVHAAVEQKTKQNIKVKLPRIPKVEKAFLDYEQIPKYLEVIAEEPRDIRLISMLALQSLRLSEIFGLRWTDIDWKNNTIHIRGARVHGEDHVVHYQELNKTDASNRVIPIMVSGLSEILKETTDTEFIVDIVDDHAYEKINKLCAAAELPEIGVHGLRHSFASLCYHLQIPELITMKLGGWSNSKTVHDIYTHLANKDIANATRQLANFFKVQNANENANVSHETQ
ncbi:MAG: site-specific integrase [Clostridia bacterium]|nr:site-specific integrase [Clostridia bacterium]